MNYIIPLKKQSKKNRKEFYSKMRKTWDINPVSKIVPNKKKNYIDKTERNLQF